jgi:hypothetical protein
MFFFRQESAEKNDTNEEEKINEEEKNKMK